MLFYYFTFEIKDSNKCFCATDIYRNYHNFKCIIFARYEYFDLKGNNRYNVVNQNDFYGREPKSPEEYNIKEACKTCQVQQLSLWMSF